MKYRQIRSLSLVLLATAVLQGCSSLSVGHRNIDHSTTPASTNRVSAKPIHAGLSYAREMLGAPYRYGGADPRGFDCSGLVYYAYRRAGIEIPRTTQEQYRESDRVDIDQLLPGDLLFFNISRSKPSHVGIYAGDSSFIHAPSRGRSVTYASLDDDYWRGRLIGTGRIRAD